MTPPYLMFPVISLVIGIATYPQILDIINGHIDFWTVFWAVVGVMFSLYYLGAFIVIECEQRKKS